MLHSLSKTAWEYRARAAAARAFADAATDPNAKRHYREIEWHWLDRALDYEPAEWFAKA